MRSVILILTASTLLLSGCFGLGISSGISGSGNITTKTIDLEKPTESLSLRLSNSALIVEKGERNQLVITGDDNLLDLTHLKTRNQKLTIKGGHYYRPLYPTETIQIKLITTAPNLLNEIELSGAGVIVAHELNSPSISVALTGSGDITLPDLSTDALNVSLTGSGDIFISGLNTHTLDANITGPGEMHLSGNSDYQNVSITGPGTYNAFELASKNVELFIAGSGDIHIDVSESLDAYIAGSGDINFLGNPTVTSNIVGSGDVTQIMR